MLKKTYIFVFFILGFTNLFGQKPQTIDTLSLSAIQISLDDNLILDTTGIDTLQYKIYVFDEYEKDFPVFINLGQFGTAALPLSFADRKNYYDFPFADNYYYYLFPYKHFYFKTNKPYTNFKYDGGMKYNEDQYLSVIHTQTHGNNNFGIRFKLYTAQNLSLVKDNSPITNFNIWYFTKYKKIDFLFNLRNINIKKMETGGYIDTASSFDPFHVSDAEFFLSDVTNDFKSLEFFMSEAYHFKSDIILRHSLSARKISKIFSEQRPNTQFFGEPLISEFLSYDSTGVKTLENKFSINYKNNFGIIYTNSLKAFYYFRGFLYNLTGEIIVDNSIKTFASQNFGKSIIGTSATIHFTDINTGDLYINGFQKFNIIDSVFKINLYENFSKYTPSYFYEHYAGNYNIWENNFKDINNFSFKSEFDFPSVNANLTYQFNFYKNMVYWDTLSFPAQDTNLLTLHTVKFSKHFNLKPFMTDLKFIWQLPSDDSIINVPQYAATASIYFDFGVVNDALHLNVGTDISYCSQFYEYAYNPALSVIYLSYERKTSTMPLVNIFLTGRIKSAIFFLRFDNATGFLLEPYRETVQFYHLRNFYFNFGIQWWFKN